MIDLAVVVRDGFHQLLRVLSSIAGRSSCCTQHSADSHRTGSAGHAMFFAAAAGPVLVGAGDAKL